MLVLWITQASVFAVGDVFTIMDHFQSNYVRIRRTYILYYVVHDSRSSANENANATKVKLKKLPVIRVIRILLNG